jgi:polyphosphate kinase 2 (PPK2 family)
MDASNPFSSRDAAVQKLWEQWQPRSARSDKDKDKPIALADFDPGAKPFSNGNGKAEDKVAVEALAEELDALQNLLYADRRYKLLVVLQGTDTAGKDGTIRGVFGRMSALGVHAVGWKAPTEAERAHDYLWRIHQQVPAAGEITVFNRSHYEDVLVPVVNGWITPEQQRQRFAHINDFERMLSETGTRSGRTTSRPTASCWAPRIRPGRPGPSCRPTPRRTATS